MRGLLHPAAQCLRGAGGAPRRRWLSGTLSKLPVPLQPWEIKGGKEWAAGTTEDEYVKDVTRRGNVGDDVDAVCGYLEQGEAVVVDEEWDTCAEHYSGVLAAYERKRLTEPGEQAFAADMAVVAAENFMTRYPRQDHLDELHAQAHRGMSKVRRWRKQHFPGMKELYPSFHMWAAAHFPPEEHQAIGIGQLVALRDSYRTYLQGVPVLRLDERVGGSKNGKGSLAARLAFYYRPLHGVKLPHPALLELLFERLEEGKYLNRVSRVMEVGCESAVFSFLLKKYGAASDMLYLADPRPQNLNSARLNLRFLGGSQRGKLRRSGKNRIRVAVTPSRSSLPARPARAAAAAAPDAPADTTTTDVAVRGDAPPARPGTLHLILHATDPDPTATLDSRAELPNAATAAEEFLAFLQDADHYLAPSGRIVLLTDNLRQLCDNDGDPIDAVLSDPALASRHPFVVEDAFDKPFSHCTSLENPLGATDISVRTAIQKKMTGIRADHDAKAELPPGPLRQHAQVNNIISHVLGKKPRSYGTKYGNYMKHLGWSEINKLNNEVYTPEAADKEADARAHAKERLVGRLLIIKRRDDPVYRMVNLGQRRAGAPIDPNVEDNDPDDPWDNDDHGF
eukprot:TRINITY_DN19476_c0_g1_i1.p1 TRINITY_DN19476_c0_g1~~TRINITY_DN19476_c0_g1_i1.p1  ORF type:complete len:621 (+),score=245.25 TRINITY_DN19476_c0_g1_i1:52-1914(+)